MWMALWLLVTAFLVGVTGWSYAILVRQKKAWEAYAKKKNLVFQKGTLMGAPEVSGVIGSFKINVFTAERPSQDIRGRRYISGVEVTSARGAFDGIVAGTKEMLPFMQSLSKLHPYTMDKVAGWDANHFVFVTHDAPTAAYLTAERAEALGAFLRTKNVDAVIAITAGQIVMRVETFDPLQDAEKIDKAVDRMIMLCERLLPSVEESAALTAQTPAAAANP